MIQENVLEVINLTKKYNLFTLDKISFKLKKGQITGFIGINGAGKTTTIKSLAGLVIPDSGEIKFFQETVTNKSESRIRDRLGFLLDGDYFYPEFTVKQMKNIFSKTYTNWDEDVFSSFVSRFNLPMNQKISKFSKGMKIKFSLSLALSHHAEVLIMDEPTSGLDPLAREELIDLFKNLSSEGVSILFSSHITSDLEKVADDIILINRGKILFQENVEYLENSYLTVKDDYKLLDYEKEKLFLRTTKEKNNFKGVYRGTKEDILRWFPSAKIETSSIEDIMMANILKY
mgnify:CR=1 FL=1